MANTKATIQDVYDLLLAGVKVAETVATPKPPRNPKTKK